MNSSAEHPLDLSAREVDVDRTPVRAIGFELGAVELGEQLANLALLKCAANPDRAVTGELFEPFLERALARSAQAILAHTVEHVREQLGAAFDAKNRRGPLEQQRCGTERF